MNVINMETVIAFLLGVFTSGMVKMWLDRAKSAVGA